jgi:hypothetical protein
VKSLSRQQRIVLIYAIAIAGVFAALLLPPIPQDAAYHNFVDIRNLCGIPNFGNVSSNSLFILVGIAGLIIVWKKKALLEQSVIWMTFFAGVLLTGFGSSYYHLAPNNQTLVWDRLPMTISFMSLFSALIAERIDQKAGNLLFPLLVGAGIGSVGYWSWTESMGHGDLRFYGLVQFLPIMLMSLIIILFPARHGGTKYLFLSFAGYALAKALEYFDSPVFNLTRGIISGHTLKHIAAALSAGCIIGYVTHLADKRRVA